LGRCTELIKSYDALTKGMKLRPRPVPTPIWWMSVATLTRMDPRLYSLWAEGIEPSVCDWWRRLDRSGECEVCDRPVEEIDEVWEYDTTDDGAVARLVGFRKLCRRCHLATHMNLAERAWMAERVLGWLQAINGLSRAEAVRMVRLAAEMWRCLNSVPREKWTFELPAVEEEDRRALETLLNAMAKSKLYDVSGGWVWTTENERVELISAEEALESAPPIDEIVKRADALGLRALRGELEHALGLLKSGMEREVPGISVTPVGKWIIFLPTPEAVELFRRVAQGIASGNTPALQAKVSVEREERKVVIVYTPNFLDAEAVAKTAEWLESLGAKGLITYKPDVFTLAGIYRGHPRFRPHVYEFRAYGEEPKGSLDRWL